MNRNRKQKQKPKLDFERTTQPLNYIGFGATTNQKASNEKKIFPRSSDSSNASSDISESESSKAVLVSRPENGSKREMKEKTRSSGRKKRSDSRYSSPENEKLKKEQLMKYKRAETKVSALENLELFSDSIEIHGRKDFVNWKIIMSWFPENVNMT